MRGREFDQEYVRPAGVGAVEDRPPRGAALAESTLELYQMATEVANIARTLADRFVGLEPPAAARGGEEQCEPSAIFDFLQFRAETTSRKLSEARLALQRIERELQ